jgi:hypothetical protein
VLRMETPISLKAFYTVFRKLRQADTYNVKANQHLRYGPAAKEALAPFLSRSGDPPRKRLKRYATYKAKYQNLDSKHSTFLAEFHSLLPDQISEGK